MRITLEHESTTTTITEPVTTASDLINVYLRLGIAAGWAESNLVDAMGEVAYLRDEAAERATTAKALADAGLDELGRPR